MRGKAKEKQTRSWKGEKDQPVDQLKRLNNHRGSRDKMLSFLRQGVSAQQGR